MIQERTNIAIVVKDAVTLSQSQSNRPTSSIVFAAQHYIYVSYSYHNVPSRCCGVFNNIYNYFRVR